MSRWGSSSAGAIGWAIVGRAARVAVAVACGLGWAAPAVAAPAGSDPAEEAPQDELAPIKTPDKPDLPSTGNKNLDLLLEMQPPPADRTGQGGAGGTDAKAGKAPPPSPSSPVRRPQALDSGDAAGGPSPPRAHSALADGLLSEAARLVEEREREQPQPGERRWVGPGDADAGRRGGTPSHDVDAQHGDSERWLIPRSMILYLRENRDWIIGGGLALWAVLRLVAVWRRRRFRSRFGRRVSGRLRHHGRRNRSKSHVAPPMRGG